MNITFLLGNGFDKALGLKTGYSEFYEWYTEVIDPGEPEHIRAFKREIKKFIKNDANANLHWSDAELGLANYTGEFSDENIEEFMDCYEDFRENLMTYLIQETGKLSDDLAQKIAEKFSEQLFNFYQEVDPIAQDIFERLFRSELRESELNIISFNYTNAINKIYSELSQIPLGSRRGKNGRDFLMTVGTLIHAHGYTDSWPIIGVCNPENIKNESFLNNPTFKAMMIKKESIASAGELWRNQTQSTIERSDIICIFGMSIGETDSDYWKMIIDWLRDSSGRQLIVFWRNSNIKNIRTSIKNKVTEKQKVLDRLCSFSGIQDATFDSIRNRIHIVFNAKNMFSLPEELKVRNYTEHDSEDKQAAEEEFVCASEEELEEFLSVAQ